MFEKCLKFLLNVIWASFMEFIYYIFEDISDI